MGREKRVEFVWYFLYTQGDDEGAAKAAERRRAEEKNI